jgi:uncharacterized protein (DUF779 family)
MAQQITATPATLDLLERLQAQHGDLIVHISGGCCDGSSPMCLRAADLPASPHDVQLGVLGGVPVVIDGDQNSRWLHPSFHLDVAVGAAGGFSLEALEDLHFTAASGEGRNAPENSSNPSSRSSQAAERGDCAWPGLRAAPPAAPRSLIKRKAP